MLINIAGWLILVAVSVALGWLTFRAWRAKRALLKWGGVVLSGLLTMIVGAVSVVALNGLVKFYAPRDAPIPDLTVAGTPEQVERGRYLANSFCASCHSVSGELPLTGGVDLGQEIPLPIGSFVTVNLTPAGPLKDWSDGEIFRAIRDGIDRDGRLLIIMSIVPVRLMSDEDIQAVIAYLRSQPAVVNETPDPPDQPNFLAVVMRGAGLLPEGPPPVTGVITAPPRGPTAAYGEYLVGFMGCRDCHGADLTGGIEGQLAPVGPSLRVVKGWTPEQFITTLRTGVDPGGYALNNEIMPWKEIGRLDDEDLTAIFEYLSSLP